MGEAVKVGTTMERGMRQVMGTGRGIWLLVCEGYIEKKLMRLNGVLDCSFGKEAIYTTGASDSLYIYPLFCEGFYIFFLGKMRNPNENAFQLSIYKAGSYEETVSFTEGETIRAVFTRA